MSQISTVSPSESTRPGPAHRLSGKGPAEHPLFAGLLEQAGLGLENDPTSSPMAADTDASTDTGKETQHDGPALVDWALLGLPQASVQEPASAAGPLESATPDVADASARPALAADPESSTIFEPESGHADADTAAAADTSTPSSLPSDPAPLDETTPSLSESPASTVSKARRSAVSMAAQAHAQAAGAARLDLQGWEMLPQGTSASVQLQASATAALNAAPLAEAQVSGLFDSGSAGSDPQGQDSGASQPQTGGSAGRGDAQGVGNGPLATDTAPKGFALSLGRAMGEAFDQLGTQISMWASQNMKRASISLDTGLGQALEVDVSLQDGQAQLAFRTDDAVARAALQNNAQQVMADLLARNGLGLAGLSVGARAQEGQPGQDSERGGGPRGMRGHRVAALAPEAGTTTQWVARSGRALDVYA